MARVLPNHHARGRGIDEPPAFSAKSRSAR